MRTKAHSTQTYPRIGRWPQDCGAGAACPRPVSATPPLRSPRREQRASAGFVELSVLMAVMLGLLLTGCSGGSSVERVPVYRVSGTVTHEGRFPENALVLFHPATRANDQTPNPSGRVQADGTYELTTYENGDGAPEGDYVVTVVWQQLVDAPDGSGDKLVGPNLIPPNFSDPRQSQVRAKVAPTGENRVPEIQIAGWAGAPTRTLAPINPELAE